MPVTINGTTGIAGVDGSASTPSYQGTDTNTGIFYPAADTIAFAEGGTESMRIDSSGNVGIGTTSPISGSVLDVASGTTTYPRVRSTIGSAAALFFQNSDTGTTTSDGMYVGITGAEEGVIWNNENTDLRIATNNTERARITSGGSLLIGKTAVDWTVVGIQTENSNKTIGITTDTADNNIFLRKNNVTGNVARFWYNATEVGSISITTTATTYSTSSDYRLKENIQPMTGALDKIAQLKPVTYDWKSGGSSQGFIAHELAEVCPDAVTGEKDAVNEDGSIKPQGIDTSFLVATLTAAIQELKSELDAAKARIAVLEAK